MIDHCKNNLNELKGLLIKLDKGHYTRSLELLSGATIGQHVRHILEFYQCVARGVDGGVVSYDNRVRDQVLETDVRRTIREIDTIKKWLGGVRNNRTLLLNGNFSSENDASLNIGTSVYRELAYCYEHSIHHQALIKIGLKELEIGHLIDENFGVAPATIRHKSTCAQ